MRRPATLFKLTSAATLLIFALTFACASAGAAPPGVKKPAGPAAPAGAGPAGGGKGKPVTFTTLVQRSVPGQSGGEVRAVARDADTWAALWASLRQNGGDALPATPPAVDFPREMALVVAMPTQSCVSKVTIQSIGHLGSPTNGTLLVTLLEEPPAPNCRCAVAARPIHAVRLPRTGGTLRFVINKGQTSCGGSPAPSSPPPSPH
jgi:ABC-type amino acid transport substrate-binding protein